MSDSSAQKTQKLQISLDYRFISIGLLLAIVVLLFIWKPWGAKATDRTVQVTGQATISTRPDQFVFYPTYEFTNTNKQAALDALTAKSADIVAGLKKLGVADKDIKTNANGNNWYYPVYSDGKSTYNLSLTVTVNSDSLAQKVQDYLISTTPSGSVSPQSDFSDKKRKEIEDQGRDQASKDARKKAEQSAKNLGFKLTAVKSVNDGTGFGGYPVPMYDGKSAMATDSAGSSLSIQPGQNDLTYTVTVVYYIR
jgi:uncharacterized protein YggE